ncbi:MAG: hypothetical protein P8R42_13215 [Candidatus Binatia bacterium]|nr:hypothetical protein [Candidatus Binatia bacterium]
MSSDRILVLGLMGRFPMAGIGWQALHYLIGLQRLGYDVYYAEDSGAPPYDPEAVGIGTDAERNVRFVRTVMQRTAQPDHWMYWDSIENRHHGLGAEALHELYATSDQIWNLSGATRLREEHRAAGARVYLQTDPGPEQVGLAANDPEVVAQIDAHDVLFTYGENLTRSGARIPTSGRTWHPTRPPVLLDEWEADAPDGTAPFSTIGSWRTEGKDVSWDGHEHRWSKHESFLELLEAPRTAGVEVDAALAPPPDVAARMIRAGWSLRDPYEVSADLEAYRRFVHASCGEFTAAKDVYVRSRSGWFSDRSACYLASSRPVVTQDTGVEDVLPVGEGVVVYDGPDGATEALRDVHGALPAHATAARGLAEAYFDAARVLPRMLDVIAASRP